MDKKTDLLQTSLRPQFYNDINQWSLKIMNEFFYNNNAPNLENVGNRYVGKGASYFTSVNLSYLGKYFVFTFEPFYFRSQNKIIKHLNRGGQFDYLNDIRHEDSTPYIIYGLRESQLYLRYGEVGFGYSNANMWLGPGIHTSLTMSNNTTGFPHFMIGTIKEKKYNNIGINTRYVISQLKDIKSQPFYSALYGTISIYTEPIITIGFNRNLLFSKIINGKQIKKIEAILKLFDELDNVEGTYQTIISYFIFDFPKSNLKVFFELGTTDYWHDFKDFLNYPDHGIGSIIGIRKYGILNNNNLVMGFEYARLLQSSFWNKRPTQNWYGNSLFNYSSYEGRRWAAHSGSDSDDLYIYFGFQNDKWSFIPSLNYERHGVLYTRPPEVKMEIRFDIRYKLNNYKFNIYLEREWLEHAGFVLNKWRNGNVIWFGIERDLTNMLSNKLGFLGS